MPIQTEAGQLTLVPGDLQFTYRGKTVGIKIRVLDYPVILGCERQPDGSWKSTEMLYEEWANDSITPASDLAKYGGAVNFVRNVLRPKINAWLARLFPASTTPTPPADPLQQIDAAILGLKFVAGADGTLRVE